MPTKKKRKHTKNNQLLFKNKGFSAFFVVVVVAIAIFLAGAFESLPTTNPVQAIPDPNDKFVNAGSKDSLQLRTLGFITVTQPPVATAASPGVAGPPPGLCTSGGANDEPEILVGYAPANGQSVSAGGQIKVWINDEGAPIISAGEQLDQATGQIVTPGNRAQKASDNYLWEPALYISPQTAESGGTPHFPTFIKGAYNNNPSNQIDCDKGGSIPTIPGMEPVPAGGNLKEKCTAEDIWDVSSLGLAPGSYTAEFVIHDGDDNRGVGCVSITIQ